MSDAPLWTRGEVVAYLQVSRSWIDKLVARNAIPFEGRGRFKRFRKSAIDAWMAGGGHGAHV